MQHAGGQSVCLTDATGSGGSSGALITPLARSPVVTDELTAMTTSSDSATLSHAGADLIADPRLVTQYNALQMAENRCVAENVMRFFVSG